MSFGFGVGDFLAVGNLAWNVYRSCKGLTEEFQEVCREALTVHTVIKELQDEAADPRSLLNTRGAPRRQELLLLIKNLEEVLKELDEIVRKYQGLARRERKIWNQLRLATEDLNTIRSKLTFHVTAINAFTSSLSRGTLVQIEKVLVELMSEIRQGRRQPSLASLHETNNDSVWKELESEMAGEGISSTDLVKHKAAIKVFVQGLLVDSNADTVSLVEVASFIKSGNDDTDPRSLSHGLFATDILPGDPAGLLTTANAQNDSLASMDGEEYRNADEEYGSTDEEYGSTDEEYESADEEVFPEDAGASNVTRHVTGGPVFNDALDYLDQVKCHYSHQPNIYKQFLDIMISYKNRVLDTYGVIHWISALFIGHPEFVQDFNNFLPVGCRVDCGTVDNHYAFRVVTPFAAYTKIPDLEAMQWGGEKSYLRGVRWIDPASLNILRPYSNLHPPLDWTTEQRASCASEVTEARRTSIRRLKAFLRRLKASKKAEIDTGRSDKANGTTNVSDRPGLAMSLRRAPQLK